MLRATVFQLPMSDDPGRSLPTCARRKTVKHQALVASKRSADLPEVAILEPNLRPKQLRTASGTRALIRGLST